ncbi:MAG: glycosyltransferase [Candidatus Pacearchaeota archaeon]
MLSIIIPTKNEEGNIGNIIKKILKLKLRNYEIIIADSNSKDNTVNIAKNFAKKFPIKIIQTGNADLSNAVKIAINYAKGDIILVMDADLEHPPEFIPKILKELKENDIVIASRYIKGAKTYQSFLKRFVSRIYILLTHLIIPSTKNIKDPSSGFFAFRKKILKNIKLEPIGFKILLEILVKAKYNKVSEVPFNFMSRKSGKSKFNLKQAFISFKHLLKLAKYKKEHHRFVKFCIVGISGIIVNEGLLWLLTNAGLFYLFSSLIAIESSIIWNFFLNDIWTFNKERKGNFFIRCLKFNISRIMALIINFSLLWLLVSLGIYYLIANLIGIFIATIFTYLTSLFGVWK